MARTETLERATTWERVYELEAAGRDFLIAIEDKTPPRGVVTSTEEFDRLAAAGEPIPPVHFESLDSPRTLTEEIIGPNGEVFRTRDDYVRFELNDALRIIHEDAVAESATPPTRAPQRSRPQGILAAVALIDRSPVSIPEICAWNEILPSDNLERAANILVEEGFLKAEPDKYGGERPAYGLVISSLDSYTVIRERAAQYDKSRKEKPTRQGLLRRKPRP